MTTGHDEVVLLFSRECSSVFVESGMRRAEENLVKESKLEESVIS
jgi:hypothetical protein